MPETLTQYKVFFGSPGGLEKEREAFHDKLQKFTQTHSQRRGVIFQPVGWEETLNGVGRPQAIINNDLEQCDYAIFALHDRWGTPTGSGHTSGTEEEWTIAESLYKRQKLRKIALFFKKVNESRLKDPGDQLRAVTLFRKSIEDRKQHLFRQYDTAEQFLDALENHLAQWLLDHENFNRAALPNILVIGGKIDKTPETGALEVEGPSFEYWVSEAYKLMEATDPDYTSAAFCATKAVSLARSDVEWARAKNTWGITQTHIGRPDNAIISFSEIEARFTGSMEIARQFWEADALYNRALLLSLIGRTSDALLVYSRIVDIFGSTPEPALRTRVVTALIGKANSLGKLNLLSDALAVYEKVISEFSADASAQTQAQVAAAHINKGGVLGDLGRPADAIKTYDYALTLFSEADFPEVGERIAMALINKAIALNELGLLEEELSILDDILGRFGAIGEKNFQEHIAKTLLNKGETLGSLERIEEEIAAYDDLVSRFKLSTDQTLLGYVANALGNKGITLSTHQRGAEAIKAYDEILIQFGNVNHSPTLEQVAKAYYGKGLTLHELGRDKEAVTVYDQLLSRFGTGDNLIIGEHVAKTLVNKGITLERLGLLDFAMATYEEALRGFNEIDNARISEQVVKALLNKLRLLPNFRRKADGIKVCDEIISRTKNATWFQSQHVYEYATNVRADLMRE